MASKRGRKRVHDRVTNDDVSKLGEDLPMPKGFTKSYNETKKMEMNDDCRKDYRRRLNRIIKYLETDSPETKKYFDIGTRIISPDERKDETKFFFPNYKRDLKYTGMNEKFILSFLASRQTKTDGTLKSHGDLRKYFDAINFGAKVVGESLPKSFYTAIDPFLDAYKKKITKAKKDGEYNEKSADPIPVALYKLILKWALEANNIMVWFWTLAQWNFMARCANIDPLRFENFSLGPDSIVGKYDDSKMDKNAERLSVKNLYANPFDWTLCFWTGLGIWVGLQREHFDKNSKIFLGKKSQRGTASSKYSEQLLSVIINNGHMAEVTAHMQAHRLNPHGIRKGSATHATSGTTAPPSLPSIARRGEWSIGVVLDIYLHFCAPQDYYLGRIVACLDPNEVEFATLPPHFTTNNPMANEYIRRGMRMMYGKVLDDHPNFVPILLRCFASIIYHSEKLIEMKNKIPGHQFNNLRILSEDDLLKHLRPLVTTDRTVGVMDTPTGIPPHINQAKMLKQVVNSIASLRSDVKDQTTTIIEGVNKFLNKRDMGSGQITPDQLTNMLNDLQKKVDKRFEEQETLIKKCLRSDNNSRTPQQLTTYECHNGREENTFIYNERFNYVPRDWKFPSVNLRQGLEFWCLGLQVSNEGKIRKRVVPFRKLGRKLWTTKLKEVYNIQWKPFFSFLEDGMDSKLPKDTKEMSEVDIEDYYEKCVNFLRKRVSYCFINEDKSSPLIWKLSTWSKSICPSEIKKKGTDEDKAFLKEPEILKHWNKPRKSSGRKRKTQENVKHPKRQRRRLEKKAIEEERIKRQDELLTMYKDPTASKEDKDKYFKEFCALEAVGHEEREAEKNRLRHRRAQDISEQEDGRDLDRVEGSTYNVVFTTKKLGLDLSMAESGEKKIIIVHEVNADCNFKNKIHPGDEVLSVGKCAVHNGFSMEFLIHLLRENPQRPLTISFKVRNRALLC